jgi:Protein of unknown function (DUF1592)/Protein of unknown function (DUF1588)/Protein of unknown function (DUF1585)/Protein of unknown function (DUF1587)/Protein of unknown function (DUF1595)/Planctomycete cytochrome C
MNTRCPRASRLKHLVHVFWPILVATTAVRAATNLGASEFAMFTDRYCSSCHNDVDKEGGLDLTALTYLPSDAANFTTWVKVHDRVANGEMPPREKKRPKQVELTTFTDGLAATLVASERETIAREGRALRRRMNRSEYENALRDLLHAPWLLVSEQLPEDGEAFRFNKVGTALDVSYVHMVRYMAAADYAMRQTMAVKYVQPPTTTTRYYAREDGAMGGFTGQPVRTKFPVLGTQPQPEVRSRKAPMTVGGTDPAIRELEAVGWVASNYVTGFSSNWANFRAPVAGRYRLRFSGYTVWVGPYGQRIGDLGTGANRREVTFPPDWYQPNMADVGPGRRYEPITVYAQGGVQNRRLGGFDLATEPTVNQLDDVWLLANEYLVTDATRFLRSRPTGSVAGGYTNPLAQRDGQPGVAFRWMEVEGPLYDRNTTAGYQMLFGDLPLRKADAGEPGVLVDAVAMRAGRGRGNRGAGMVSAITQEKVEVVSSNPEADAERLLRAFMQRAYRRPPQEADVQLFLALVRQRVQAGLGFAGSLLAGYTAVLSSPEFVFVDEKPGRLDDAALATRLALFLWNSEPDDALRARAARGELRQSGALRTETERMLADRRSERFIAAFINYWLDLRKMEETTPSTTLYNDYYLDDSLTEAALMETQLYVRELVQRNLPARNIVDSDFTFLNDRLASHYGIAGVDGVAMRRVALPVDSVRGGLLTQASVLKVTANGTTTSPVVRGKWIMERIVGFEMPLPPAAVPAVEPDIRGAVTIRQQLDKHRADESCAMCHRKIDPPGFALESFDVMGAWRDRYRATATDASPAPGFGKNGWPFAFYHALPVDSSGELAGGRAFKDVRDFKRLLLDDEAQIARNLAKQLSIFATGAPVRFSDREAIEKIVERARSTRFGVRTILDELIESELFLSK